VLGNFVRIRGTDEKIWETMPLYVRVGMHILFRGPIEVVFFACTRYLLTNIRRFQGETIEVQKRRGMLPSTHSNSDAYLLASGLAKAAIRQT
jgi:hypothetical protein